jgi:hypothetical protein
MYTKSEEKIYLQGARCRQEDNIKIFITEALYKNQFQMAPEEFNSSYRI